jgi:hypothetical protein
MALATFDKTNLPKVVIKFTENKLTDDNFHEFITMWDNCDLDNSPYNFYFDFTENSMSGVKLKYIVGLASFLKRKKKQSTKYLQYSVINVAKKKTLLLLLRMVFNLSAPIASVYIIADNSPEYITTVYEAINTNTQMPKGVIKFFP